MSLTSFPSIVFSHSPFPFCSTLKIHDLRAIVSFNVAPSAVRVDYQEYPFSVMKGNDCFSIFLPSGRHYVELIAGDQFSFGVNVTSLWSTTAIAMFGFVAVTSLFIMYIVLKVIKRTAPQRKAS